MILMGVDPGSRFCGYGLLEVQKYKIIAAGCGVITIRQTLSLPDRLLHVYQNIKKLIEEHKPGLAAVESIFYGKNIQTSFTLGHVRGVILLAFAEYAISVSEYAPREIKQSVVGNGSASKQQVAYMVQNILNLKNQVIKDDAADGLAAALCLFNKEKFNLILQKS